MNTIKSLFLAVTILGAGQSLIGGNCSSSNKIVPDSSGNFTSLANVINSSPTVEHVSFHSLKTFVDGWSIGFESQLKKCFGKLYKSKKYGVSFGTAIKNKIIQKKQSFSFHAPKKVVEAKNTSRSLRKRAFEELSVHEVLAIMANVKKSTVVDVIFNFITKYSNKVYSGPSNGQNANYSFIASQEKVYLLPVLGRNITGESLGFLNFFPKSDANYVRGKLGKNCGNNVLKAIKKMNRENVLGPLKNCPISWEWKISK